MQSQWHCQNQTQNQRLKSFYDATLRDVTSRKALRAAARNANVPFRLSREDTEGQPVDTPAAFGNKKN